MEFKLSRIKNISLMFIAAFVLAACGGAPDSGGISDGSGGTLKIGNGGGESFNDGEVGEELTSSGVDGATWDLSVVVVGGDNLAVNTQYSVSFSSSCVSAGLASFNASQVTTVAGRASVTYTSTTCDGVDTVVATLGSGDDAISATVDLDINSALSDDSPGSTDSVSIKIGSGGGDSFSDGVAEAVLDLTDPTAGFWVVSVVVVDGSNLAVTDEYTVTFFSTCVSAGLSTLSAASVVTVAGRASLSYTPNTCSGIDTLVAQVGSGSAVIEARVDLTIAEAAGGNVGSSNEVFLGNGAGSGFAVGVIGTTSSSIQAGGSTILNVNLVDGDGIPYSEVDFSQDVSFSSGCSGAGIALFSDNSPVFISGVATTTYTASGCSGEDVITARATVRGQTVIASITLDIALDTVLGVEFVSVSEADLAIAGIGGLETSTVVFRVVGAQGAPIVGEDVSFELSNTAGGARLSPGTELGETNTVGEVSTVVQSGTVNSSLRVIATHIASTYQGLSSGITISTGVPVSRSFDLSYDLHNPLAADVNNVTVVITANATDQHGNAAPDGLAVSFRTPEVGTIEPFCVLENGTCSVNWISSGDRNFITPDESGRGYRATVIGFMSGAEDFIDFNSNGLFDASNSDEVASLVQLGEAYVDQNENGVFDAGEDFVDSFLNSPAPTEGVSGGLNEAYDSSSDATYSVYNGPCSTSINPDCPVVELQTTTIWDSVVISLSSNVVAICDLGTLPAVGDTITLPFSVSGLAFCDENGNSLPSGSDILFSTPSGGATGYPLFLEVRSDTTNPFVVPSFTISEFGVLISGAPFEIITRVDGIDTSYVWPMN